MCADPLLFQAAAVVDHHVKTVHILSVPYSFFLNDQIEGAQMRKYKQLTSDQRYQIYGLTQAGLNQTQIAQNKQ